jgi:hypothetical protein
LFRFPDFTRHSAKQAARAVSLVLALALACGPSPSVDTVGARALPASSVAASPRSPAASQPATASGSAAASEGLPERARASAREHRFPPPDITPPSARSADDGDGRWQALSEPLVYSTVLHPHETSRFITITIAAIDLTRVRLEFLPGVDDVGKQQVPFTPGLVPSAEQSRLIAVFNGGFMPQHGRWGMRLGETTVLPPRDLGCTIALFQDGAVKIGSWPALAPAAESMRALRQTPPCLLEEGALHPQLLAGRDRAWAGHTPGIVTRRRSAIGLSADGQTLLYAIGVEASPKLLAVGLSAAGAHAAAQLDINWNWTRFLLFGTGPDGKLGVRQALAEVQHARREYVELPSKRDFFYLLER